MDGDPSRLDAIVGAAIRGLVEAGASDAAIGQFAAAHRLKVASLLGQPAAVTTEPDLVDLVRQAVVEAMAGVRSSPSTESRVSEKRKRVPVLVGGKRTTVTVRPALMDRLVDAAGGRRKATQLINEFVSGCPDEENRSGWLDRRLESYVQSVASLTTSTAKH